MSFIPLSENLSADKDQKPDQQQQYIKDYCNQDREAYLGKKFVPLRMVDDDTDDVEQDCADKAAERNQKFCLHPLA
jgi:hypothetical protein